MDGFHPQVGQLVGHVVIGAADGYHLVLAHHLGVGRAQVVLLVNDRFGGVGDHRHTAEGHLAVTAVEGAHQAFLALGITGDDGHLPGQVDLFKGLLDLLVQGQHSRGRASR